jgi:NTE family protein
VKINHKKECDHINIKKIALFFNIFALFAIVSSFASSPWAVVLSGGGARGAYEAGALKAISEIGLDVKGVYGTSVGALNGAFYVQGGSKELYEMWQHLSFENVMTLPSTASTESSNFSFYKVFKIIISGGFDVTPLKTLISGYLDENKIRESGIDFGLVTIDISNFTPLELYISDIPHGELVDYLMASANYPFFQRWKIGNSLYIDGGFYNNAPVSMALKKGFKRILLVNVSDVPFFLPEISSNVELKIVKPSQPLGTALEFVPSEEKIWEEMGYLDTMKAFGKLMGKEYYIYPSKQNILIDTMLKMKMEEVKKLAELLNVNIKKCSVDFAVYERIIPKLLTYVPSTSFEKLNLSLLEEATEYLKTPRLKTYTQRSLCFAISQTQVPTLPFWEKLDLKRDKIARVVKYICERIR